MLSRALSIWPLGWTAHWTSIRCYFVSRINSYSHDIVQGTVQIVSYLL